ncbi:MAG: Mth938-like domain-containing protein [Marivivens sp.]
MRLNEVVYSGAVPVEGYGPGFFRLGGEVYEGPILVMPSGISGWGGVGDPSAILAAADQIDVLFVGMGAEIAPLDPAFRAVLEEAGIGVEIMASPTACRTYNVLLSEWRRVGLALLPV